MSSSLNRGWIVTIVCEAVLQDRLIKLLQTLGVSGYTIIPAQGMGSHGRRMGDMAGYNTNIEVKTIVSLETSDKLLEELKNFSKNHASIAFRHEVEGLFD
ncbi:P-II family nitrogen regulator [Myxosarcina sp. GI1(2024)]